MRQLVLETAADLFAERGFAGASFTDIADALGMSRPGLYYHFPSKEALLEALVQEVTLSGLEEASALGRSAEVDPSEALRRLVARMCAWQGKHGKLFRALHHSENELPEVLRRRHEEGKRATLTNIVSIIERGIKVGQFRPVDAQIAAFGIIGMCTWMAWWFRPDGRVAANEVVELLADAAVHTVLRVDSHRSRSEHLNDMLRILREDVAHLERVLRG